jgi:hypothetical protein
MRARQSDYMQTEHTSHLFGEIVMANPNTNENMTVHFKVKDPRGPHCIVIVAELRPVSTRIGDALSRPALSIVSGRAANVRFGSFATEPFRASAEKCPLCLR